MSTPLTISATGGNTAFAVFPSQSWLSVSPSSGTTPLQVTVTANPAGLSASTYMDNNFKVVTATQTILVPVTFTVSALGVSPQSIGFAYTIGNPANPQGQVLTLTGQFSSYTLSATTASGGNWLQATASGNQVNLVVNGLVLASLPAGTYQGTVTVSPAGSLPVSVPVTLTVSPEPPVSVTPASVNLFYQTGGLNNQGAQQTVTLSTTSATALPFVFGQPSVGPNPAGRNWILVNPSTGNIPAGGSAQSVISYDATAALPANTYTGTVPVAATGGQVNVANGVIPVNLLVSSNPLLFVPTQALNFTYELNGSTPASQNVTPQSTAVAASSATGQMPIAISGSTQSGGNWLSVVPVANPTTGMPFTVSVNPANLLPGTYTGNITVSPALGAVAGNGPQNIAVTLTVANDPSIVANVPTQGIVIPFQLGQNAPANQTIALSSSTGAQLNYTVTSAETTCGSVNWLTLGGTTGSTNGSFTVMPANLASLGAGNCTGAITVTATNPATGNSAINSPLTIPVTLDISANPLLVVTPTSLSFSLPVGSTSGTTQQITVNSTNAASNLTFTVTTSTNNGGANWLAASPLSGSTAAGSNTITVFVAPGLLSAGTYTGSITISSTGVADSPITVPVTLQVISGTLTLNQSSLNFTYTVGGSNPVAQQVQVTSNGNPLNFTAVANSGTAGASWLSVSPASGTTPAPVSVSVNGTNLSPGTYSGTVAIASPNAGNSPAIVNVTLTVNSGTITAVPTPATGLTFTQASGGAAPAVQTIALTGAPNAVNFSASATTTSGGNWLTVTPSSGTTPGSVSVSANAGTLAVGTYTGTVTITAPGATGSPLTYNVTLNVVTPITITATPSTLNFGYTLNAAAPAAQTVQIAATAPPGVGTLAIFPFTTTVTTSAGGNWLTVTPTTGNVPGSISVSANPAGLAVGNYTGTITIASGNQNGAAPATVTVKLAVTTAPTPVISAVTNAASGAAGAVSPGEEVAIYGSNFGPATVASATLANNGFPVTLSNTQVLFDGVPAPIIAVTNGQVNAMVPYGIAGRATTSVQVSYLGVSSAGITYNVAAAVPGIYTVNFSGAGQGAVLDQNSSVNSSSNPAAKNSVIQIFMTGEGVTSPPSVTGQIAPSDGTGLNKPVQSVTATIAGVPAQVQYYGSAPGLVYGVMQVNVLVPPNIASGAQQVIVTVGTTSSQSGVTVAIQ